MREQRFVPRLATVFVLILVAMLTIRCESQESSKIERSGETSGERSELLRLERFPQAVNLIINRSDGTIRAVRPNVVICRDEAACPEDQFEWRIPGGLRDGERLVVRGARRVCFAWDVLEVTPPANAARSGRYIEACEAEDKYGFFWPYIVELFAGEELIAQTDPSGIFRRR